METNRNDKELAELLRQLGVDEEHGRAIRQDIEAGDELLKSFEPAELPEALRQRVRHTVEQHQVRSRRTAWRGWAGRAAAVAAVLLTGVVLLWQADSRRQTAPSSQRPAVQQVAGQEMTVLDDEEALWEMALLQDEYGDEPMDDVMMEILTVWQESSEEPAQPVGQGHTAAFYCGGVRGDAAAGPLDDDYGFVTRRGAGTSVVSNCVANVKAC